MATFHLTPADSIQAAHDALPATGGKIVLSGGYFDQYGVNFTKDVVLVGAGLNSTFIRNGSSTGQYTLKLGQNLSCKISGIQFLKATGANMGDHLQVYGNRDTVIEFCRFRDAGSAGLHFTAACFTCTARDLRFDGGVYGIKIDSVGGAGTSNSLLLERILASAPSSAHFSAESCTALTIINPAIEAGSGIGITLDDCEGTSIYGIRQGDGASIPAIRIGGVSPDTGQCRTTRIVGGYIVPGSPTYDVLVHTAKGLLIADLALLGTGTARIRVESVAGNSNIWVRRNRYTGTLLSDPGAKAVAVDNYQ